MHYAEEGYSYEVSEHFQNTSEFVKPFLNGAKVTLKKIEQLLYKTPAFIEVVIASVPKQSFQAILTDEQKKQLADGVLKLMTKKDGTLMANLVDPKTNKIVSTVSLEAVNLTPGLTEALTSYSTQMQMAQIAEAIHSVQVAIEEVRQGQESDRLATAYSCQQRLLQAVKIRNPELRANALLSIAASAEESRNLLMQTQYSNLLFIMEQPESYLGKLLSGAKTGEINQRIHEIRESLSAVNMVSMVEATAYQELGESDAAGQSLQYYAAYLHRAYLSTDGLIQRLDSIDPSKEEYWTKTLPEINRKIQALPSVSNCLSEG